VWGYDAALYMPLFKFARMSRVPMIALNVDLKLVSQVGQQGWESVPAADREGLSDPAPASLAYLRELAGAYLTTQTGSHGAGDRAQQGHENAELDEAALGQVMQEPRFKRFVEAQLTWDRAMAEALADARQNFSNSIVVGIVGVGHVAGGYGVPRQLRALGIYEPSSLIPAAADTACALIGTGYADAIFTLSHTNEAPLPAPAQLGALFDAGDGTPHISRVVNDGVAEAAGLKAGDEIVQAAGMEMRRTEDLLDIVAKQPPGTWLPLSVRRDGREIEVVAKFPTRPKPN
jgi:hypothetical protein